MPLKRFFIYTLTLFAVAPLPFHAEPLHSVSDETYHSMEDNMLFLYTIIGRTKRKESMTLFEHATKNEWDKVKEQLKTGVNPNFVGPEGRTALFLAVKDNQYALVEELIEHGAHVNISTKQHNTPLKVATSNKNTLIIRLLKKHGATMDGKCFSHVEKEK